MKYSSSYGKMTSILIVSPQPSVRESIARRLGQDHRLIGLAADLDEATRLLEVHHCDVMFCDRQAERTAEVAGAMNAIALQYPALTIIQFAAPEHLAMAHLDSHESAAVRVSEPSSRKEATDLSDGFSFVAEAPSMRRLLEFVGRISLADCTVLITGETGTGKEVIARAIHQGSRRSAGPFIAINCGAIPDTLVESELFGHVKGAFTGAATDRAGLIEQAAHGVLLLDEIGEMPLRAQATLLRFLDRMELRRVGDAAVKRVDVRVIAATNRRLEDEVAAGRFRRDLFYRLSVVGVQLPPLRERREDIPHLASRCLARNAARARTKIALLSNGALECLTRHSWPGNVRELEHAIEAAIVNTEGDIIEAAALPCSVRNRQDSHEPESGDSSNEWHRLKAAMEQFDGDRMRVAAALGVSRTTLWRRMRRQGSLDQSLR